MLAIAKRHEEPDSLPNLVDAAEAANLPAVYDLLNEGAGVNATTSNGMTALMCAAENGHLKILSVLLDAGAEVNQVRNDGMSPLALAAFFGHFQVVEELVRRGADLDAPRSRNSPEGWAAGRGFSEISHFLKKARSRMGHIREICPQQPELVYSEAETKAVQSLDSQDLVQTDSTDSGESHLHLVDEPEWLEFSESLDVSPASVWAPEYEEEPTTKDKLHEFETFERFETNDRFELVGTIQDTTPSDTNSLDHNSDDLEDFALGTIHETTPSDMTSLDYNFDESEDCASIIKVDPPSSLLDESTTLQTEGPLDASILNQPFEPAFVTGEGEVPSPEERPQASEPEAEASFLIEASHGSTDAADMEAFEQENPEEDWYATEAIPRVRVLDESRMLPSEVSFATVELNHPIELDAIGGQRLEPMSNQNDSINNTTRLNVRLLDEARTLSAETSCATMLSQESNGYSPFAEFLVRTNLSSRRLLIVAAALISICLLATMVILKLANSQDGLASRPTVNTSANSPSNDESTVSPARFDPDERVQASSVAAKQEEANAQEERPVTSNGMSPGKSESSGKSVQEKSSAAKEKEMARAARHPERTRRKDARELNKVSRAVTTAKARRVTISSEAAAHTTGTPKTNATTDGSQRPRTVTRAKG